VQDLASIFAFVSLSFRNGATVLNMDCWDAKCHFFLFALVLKQNNVSEI